MKSTLCPSCGRKGLKKEFKFCPYCGNEQLTSRGECTSCGHMNDPDAKFCQECGKPVAGPSGDSPPSDLEIMTALPLPPNKGIVIRFGHSTSPNFDIAVKEAMKYDTFTKWGDGNKSTYEVTFKCDDIHNSFAVANYVSGWARSKLYFNGEQLTSFELYSFEWCYKQKLNSYKPDLYCFGYGDDYHLNIWGCIRAELPFFNKYAQWCRWGTWVNDEGDWDFDKERIRHVLQKKLYQYRFCPALQQGLLEEVVNALPQRVNPLKNKNWNFVEDYGGSTISEGLVIKVKHFGVNQNVKMVGVAPAGKGALKEIVKGMKLRLPQEIG